jgi:hypothetical protein
VTKENDDHNIVSVIYHTRNDSPKYIKLHKRRLILFFIGLPTITLIAALLGFIGLIHTSPFHLLKNYRNLNEGQKSIRENIHLKEQLLAANKINQDQTQTLTELKNEIEVIKSQPNQTSKNNPVEKPNDFKCPPTTIVHDNAPMAQATPLNAISLIRPIQNQKDKTRPASLNLQDFKAITNKDTVNLQFNIINLLGGDIKLSGHIIVVMKNDNQIQVYPMNTLVGTHDFQINYSAGEPFSTQRFRPVDASFLRPKKSGAYSFTVFIFARNGDLIHYQTVNMNLNL